MVADKIKKKTYPLISPALVGRIFTGIFYTFILTTKRKNDQLKLSKHQKFPDLSSQFVTFNRYS